MQRFPERDGVKAVPFFRSGPAILLALLLTLPLAACGSSQPSDALATWRGGHVTPAELDAMVRGLPAARRQPAGGESLADWIDARTRELALSEIILQRTEGNRAGDTPELDLRARYEASQEIGRGYLARQCVVDDPTEEELAEAYTRAYPQPSEEWVLVRHIYKRSLPGGPAGERAAARSALEALRADLDAGASFIELARLHSDSATAKEGGLIGRLSRRAPVEPRVREVAWALSDGEYSQVVEVSNGFHLLWREQSGVAERPALDQVRIELTQAEALRRREACGREILTRLGDENPVIIDRDALLDPNDATRAALQVAGETFSARELGGLSGDLSPLMHTPRPGELLRHFSEAVLLVGAAVAEDADLENDFAKAMDRRRSGLAAEDQWRQERLRIVTQRPEAELRHFFEQNMDRFQTDLELDVGMITVGSDGQPGRRPAMESALALRRQLTTGASFEELASEASEHDSRTEAGRLGSLPLPRLRVILGSWGAARAAELEVDEISLPVQIHDPPAASFALIKLYGRTEPRPRTFADARDDIVATQSQENVRQLDREVQESLLDEAAFKLHPAAIERYIARLRG